MDEPFKIIIASPPEYEELVAEIYIQGKYVALLSRERGDRELDIEFDLSSLEKGKKIDFDLFNRALEVARQRLLGEASV